MSCLKCGKKTKDAQVFCQQCLEVMENYPVKSDVHVQLPNRPARPLSKKSGKKRRPASVEEQLVILRSRQRRLLALVFVLVLLLGVAGVLLVHKALTPEDLDWGKNYTFENPFG